MKTIKIDYDELFLALQKEIENARDFGWTGWRIPIYVDEKGHVYAGDWLSRGSYQPGTIEIYSIKRWLTSDWVEDEDINNEECIDSAVYEVTKDVIKDFKEQIVRENAYNMGNHMETEDAYQFKIIND